MPGSAPFISFYSSRGGVGRSLAALGVASVLAGNGLRVVVIDLDLASPGLSRLIAGDDGAGQGIAELVTHLSEEPFDSTFARHSRLYALPAPLVRRPDGSLRIVPVGRLDDAARLRWTSHEQVRSWLAALKRQILAADLADLVLVDCGAGRSAPGDVATRELADHVVVFTALNHQHVAGTAEFLRDLRRASDDPRSLQCVLSPMPVGEDELTVAREQAAHDAFAGAWGAPLDLALRIDYQPRLALSEEPHRARVGRNPLHAAHVALARALVDAVGLGVEDLRATIVTAIAARDGAAALHQLRLLAALGGPDGLAWAFWALRGHLAPSPAIDRVLTFLADALPAECAELRMFATELHRAGNPRALRFYERATAAAPGDGELLGNFASFLAETRRDDARAESCYLAALAAAPHDADILGNFANFLTQVRGDHERAELCYLAAIELTPTDADHLGNYANFLATTRRDDARAEAYYQRALAVAPDDANLRGNWARLLFVRGRDPEAREQLEQALAGAEDAPELRLELLFYAHAHAREQWPGALAELKILVEEGVRSPGWDLRANVERARADNHPDAELLAELAATITGAPRE